MDESSEPTPTSVPPAGPGDEALAAVPTEPAAAPPPAPSPEPATAAPPPPASYSWQTPPEAMTTGPAPGVRFAPHGPRLVAYIVDVIIVGVVVTLISIIGLAVFFAGLSGDLNDPDTLQLSGVSVAALVFIAMVAFVVSLGYFPWFWARNGQTPGMMFFHLRVVRDRDGGPISGGQAIMRLIGLWVSQAVFYLGYIWILIDSRRRGWQDLIAGTIVIEVD
jgi:uncharacterized RDD family membrane protein YckC